MIPSTRAGSALGEAPALLDRARSAAFYRALLVRDYGWRRVIVDPRQLRRGGRR